MDSKRINLARGTSALTTALFVTALAIGHLSGSATTVLAWQLAPTSNANATATKSESDKVAAELFALGASFYSSEDWAAAIDQFKTLIDRFPDNEKATIALFYSGESLMQTGDHRSAAEYFQRFVAHDSVSELAVRASFRIGECQYMAGDREQAVSSFRTFAHNHADNPLNEFALPYLGELQLDSDDAAGARATYEAAIAGFPESKLANKCRLGLAQSLQHLGEFDEADRFYTFVAQQNQSCLDDDALLYSAKMWAAHGDWKKCGARLDVLAKRHSGSDLQPEAQYLDARRLMAQDDWPGAWVQLESILDHPWSTVQFSRVGLDAALVALRMDKLDTAVSILDRVEIPDSEPVLKEFWLALAIDLAARQSETSELESLLEQLESSFCNSIYLTRSIESLARLYYVSGNYQKAETRYRQLVEFANQDAGTTIAPESGNNAIAWQYLHGLSLLGLGEFPKASQCLNSIKDFRGDRSLEAAVSFAIATSQSGEGRYEASLPHYRKYIELLPEGPDINRCHADLALALVRCNRLDEAFLLLQPRLSTDLTDRSLLNAIESMAEAGIRAGRNDDAIKYFQLLAQSGLPDYASRGANGLIWAKGNAPVDWESINSLLSESPTPATLEALAARAQRCQVDKNFGDAIRLYETIIEFGGQSELADDSRVRLAISLIRTGEKDNRDRAADILQTFGDKNPEHEHNALARYELAWIQQEQGELRRARDSFLSISDNHPESRYWSDAIYRAAILSQQLDESAAAVVQLRRLIDSARDDPILVFAHFTLGEIETKNRSWAEAIQHFEKVQQGDPASSLVSPALYWMAECYYQKGQTAIAERHFKTLADAPFTDPRTSSAVILRLAQCYGKRDDWTAVRELLDEVEMTNPERVKGSAFDYLRARVCMSQAKFEAARQLLTSVINDPDAEGTQSAAMSQWLIGESWFHQEDYASAFRAYLLVDGLYDYPQWQALALLQAAKCQDRMNDQDAARKTIDRLMAAWPDSSVTIDAKQFLLQMKRDESSARTAPTTFSKPDQ